MTPDIIEYKGRGKCYCFIFDGVDSAYREQLRTWATSRNWEVICDNENVFSIHRPVLF